jgi:hypothetical protein
VIQLKDATYDQYQGVVICLEADAYRTAKGKETSLSSNKTFIKEI